MIRECKCHEEQTNAVLQMDFARLHLASLFTVLALLCVCRCLVQSSVCMEKLAYCIVHGISLRQLKTYRLRL